MQVKISKTLEGIIARTAFNTTKEGQKHALKDWLALELMREEGSLAHQLLTERMQAWELYQLRLRIEQALRQPPAPTDEQQEPERFFRRFTNELCAKYHDARSVSSAHALLQVVADPTTHTARLMARYHLTAEQLTEAINRVGAMPAMRPEIEVRLLDFQEPRAAAPDLPKLLDKFGTDLTAAAREGRIDPVIGREKEIERVIQALSRRKKNNPILIGEAGVGKTAIVEGLALRIAERRVPLALQEKRLFALDISALVAGTKFRGEFEERMQQLIDELKQSGDTILFIDEIHTIVGAGSTQGSLDTANILKPALARGELQTVGATTLDEYREHIERDTALERRFQRILVEPTSAADTLEILRRIAPHYEAHHRVRYTDEALRACVELTERYITDRHFPDKAIDLLDEVGARARMHTTHEPAALREQQAALATVQRERREAVEAAQYDRAAAARMCELKLRSEIEQERDRWQVQLDEQRVELDRGAVEQVITALTGIPIERIAGSEQERFRGLEQHLARRVIGQREAVERIARSILRARAGLKAQNRPIGTFLFVGPTGVGKTLLAKELSRRLFDEERGLIRLDMSEYGEKHNIARLIGSPPGYVGYGEGGQLTEAVRHRPYAVVLFDEIEKAHPEVFNTLLQLLDEGHLTDGAGRKVDFRNTILVMTSNVGSREALERTATVGFRTPSKQESDQSIPAAAYQKALERTFAPEFLNRIDEVICFRSLESDDMAQIIALELEGLSARTEALGYTLRITDRAKERLAAMGFESRYGARALKRTLTDHIEEPLAQLIIDGKLRAGDTILVESHRKSGVRLRIA